MSMLPPLQKRARPTVWRPSPRLDAVLLALRGTWALAAACCRLSVARDPFKSCSTAPTGLKDKTELGAIWRRGTSCIVTYCWLLCDKLPLAWATVNISRICPVITLFCFKRAHVASVCSATSQCASSTARFRSALLMQSDECGRRRCVAQ